MIRCLLGENIGFKNHHFDLFPTFARKCFSIITIDQSWLIFGGAKSNKFWGRVTPRIQSWQTFIITWSRSPIEKVSKEKKIRIYFKYGVFPLSLLVLIASRAKLSQGDNFSEA